MIAHAFNLIFYQPLYNGLIFLMDILPWIDAGVAVILFTALVKLALFPLSQKATRTHLEMKLLEGDLQKLKEKYKNDKEGHARATMEFYKEKKVNPFSSFFLLLVQIPIILALYYIFYRGGLPHVNTGILYPFVSAPHANMEFLGLIDITKKSLVLALLAGVTQYFQITFSVPPMPPRSKEKSFKDDLARSMNVQMRFIMPVVVAFIAYKISGAISLYWITSNLFAIGQELYIRRKFAAQKKAEAGLLP